MASTHLIEVTLPALRRAKPSFSYAQRKFGAPAATFTVTTWYAVQVDPIESAAVDVGGNVAIDVTAAGHRPFGIVLVVKSCAVAGHQVDRQSGVLAVGVLRNRRRQGIGRRNVTAGRGKREAIGLVRVGDRLDGPRRSSVVPQSKLGSKLRELTLLKSSSGNPLSGLPFASRTRWSEISRSFVSRPRIGVWRFCPCRLRSPSHYR